MSWLSRWLKRRRDRNCAKGYHRWEYVRQYYEEFTEDWDGYKHGPIPEDRRYMIGRFLRFVENRCSNCGAIWRYESYGE